MRSRQFYGIRSGRSLAEIVSFARARMAWLIPANATVLDEVKAVRNRVEYLVLVFPSMRNSCDHTVYAG